MFDSSLGFFDLGSQPRRFTDSAGYVSNGAGFLEGLVEGLINIFDFLVDVISVGDVGVVEIGVVSEDLVKFVPVSVSD